MPLARQKRKIPVRRVRKSRHVRYEPYTPLDFTEVEARAKRFADFIEQNFEGLADILLEYESFEVARDETDRTLDHLRNLKENSTYFKLRTGPVAAFLPRNQPLYALTCFVIVPSLMASEAHMRIPTSMRRFFPKLLEFLDIEKHFPNIIVSDKQRVEYLEERTAVKVNPKNARETLPVTDAVIFTGTSTHAAQLRLIFDPRTLFITNGSGHNPVVVGADADLAAAVEAVMTLQLYNQGQDCAAPNAILVDKKVLPKFLELLRAGIRNTKVGAYRDRDCRIGPISDPHDLVRIQEFLIDHQEMLDPSTPGVVRAREAIVEPTIIVKPLATGGNYMEIFAPIIVVQGYDKDADLGLYFENPRYASNAMYITIYGSSRYIKDLADRPVGDKVIHDKASILWNTHLHVHGVERGTHPYGGYGYGASNLSIKGKVTPKPTLPQRDIYEWIAKPLMSIRALEARKSLEERCTDMQKKDVAKLLRLSEKPTEGDERGLGDDIYIDLKAIAQGERRYVPLDKERAYRLLARPNAEHLAHLTQSDRTMIRALRKLIMKKKGVTGEAFQTELFALTKKPGAKEADDIARQQRFFKHVYQLLLGQDSGPRLAQFLLDIDPTKASALLDV